MFARTARLLLRPGWIEDAPALVEALGDRKIARDVANIRWPYALADAEAFLRQPQTHRAPRLLIFARGDRAPLLVGGIGLAAQEAGTTLGYWVRADFWNQGIATEAGRAMLDIAAMLGVPRLRASHFVDNPASGAVLRKLGFRSTGEVTLRTSVGRESAVTCRNFVRECGGAVESALAA